MVYNFLQMSYWVPQQGQVFLPPAKPTARVASTDEYVSGTSIFYHASSERLVTVGHPYYEIKHEDKVIVPKVSGSQYRVFYVKLPDPNKFGLPDKSIYNPEKERLVWKLRGMQIGRGGPLGVGTTGNPLFNKLQDTENPNRYLTSAGDERQNTSMDPKQVQLFVVGCTPCLGEHWDIAPRCATQEPAFKKGDCPPLELRTTTIEDGQMCDVGFGALNFPALQEDRSGVPMDISQSICKWPDFLKMENDKYGDSMFFYGKREQLYCRHFFVRGGANGEQVPESYYISGSEAPRADAPKYTNYFGTPSGSLVTSDSQIFNRPFWLQQAQGQNNGVLWGNRIFVTVCDNTRNTNFSINQSTTGDQGQYNPEQSKQYLRHTEEFELSFVLQLCTVALQPEVLSHIHVMNPSVIEDWNLGYIEPTVGSIETTYRFIDSLATKCPDKVPPKEKEDPYSKQNYWVVDLKDRLSSDLDQYPLGRKFMHQTGLGQSSRSRVTKRAAGTSSTRATKRKKGN
uniref:Major capsid protein L1 n=1 Tax=Felis catus papillomavirus 4 TaxID=1398507 RepID=A0A8D4QB26_9PAPI|nr:MAG: late protein 1 [Felis catus papillomavirus]UUK30363.1 L1 [Felis catus papillomavirus 4]BBB06253.2 major capsid protein L1 [Felis catus papillomavirus 4]